VSRLRPKLTYANVMVTALAFVVLGGGAWALTRNSVGARQIKANAVKRSEIAGNAVRSQEVADASLLRRDFAAGQLPSGPEGPPGPEGPAGAPGSDATNLFAYVRDPAPASTSPAVLQYGQGATSVTDSAMSTGIYTVVFGADLTGCIAQAEAGVGLPQGGSAVTEKVVALPVILGNGQVQVEFQDTAAAPAETSFFLGVFC
jgi:hypothetical protein